jgi:hypothetical protein
VREIRFECRSTLAQILALPRSWCWRWENRVTPLGMLLKDVFSMRPTRRRCEACSIMGDASRCGER